jgi:hypothetical protein
VGGHVFDYRAGGGGRRCRWRWPIIRSS